MPLRAIVNGQEKISITYSEEEWTALKESIKKDNLQIELPCCGQNGFLRTSSKGLKHFIHGKGQTSCDWKPETPEHLKAKIEIVNACIKSGWQAIPEYSENDWRADVLAINNEKRIAFEIQWSAQTSETTRFRQDRYKESKVRGCWFFRTIPKEYREYEGNYHAIKDIPFFKIKKTDKGELVVNFNKAELSIGDFVNSLLNKQIKFCENYTVQPNQEIEILFYETSCWDCHKPQHLYTVRKELNSCCNTQMYLMGSMWDSEDLDKNPNVINAVKQIIQTEPHFKIGEIKKRFSGTAQHTYLSFGCYHCDKIFGDFPLRTEKMEALNDGDGQIFKKQIDLATIKEEGNHWCYSPEGKFCD